MQKSNKLFKLKIYNNIYKKTTYVIIITNEGEVQ